jgi:hypothetical protein
VLLASLAVAQEPSLDLSDEADQKDEAILNGTLYLSISADDIYRSEAVQQIVSEQVRMMMDASQRRMIRQEARIAALKAQVEAGKAPAEELRKVVQEMQRRIETGYLVLSRTTALNATLDGARAEANRLRMRRGRGGTEKYAGSRPLTPAVQRTIEVAFLRQFRRPLPISAEGDTALHRALGFDHRGRIDVAVHPDQPEGMWLRRFLETLRVPYYGFRMAVPGSATAPHIHIGPGSPRMVRISAAARAPRRTLAVTD